MEYVEGTNLGKLVRLGGPLPVAVACDFTRQVALGLQHAHERCLVHRDIKPDNLLLVVPPSPADETPGAKTAAPGPVVGGQIKILDWGLAGLRLPVETQAAVDTLVPEGTVGTADYLSPEQALDIKHADIRSDLYSLGCTLYFLLTGRPPFPEGTLMQKLLPPAKRADARAALTVRSPVPPGAGTGADDGQAAGEALPDARGPGGGPGPFCSPGQRRTSPTLMMKKPALGEPESPP